MATRRTVHLLDGEGALRPLATLEAEIIAAAVKRSVTLTVAAEALGISRSTLHRKLREYSITPEGDRK